MSNGEGYRDNTADIAVAHVMKQHEFKNSLSMKADKKGVRNGTKIKKSNKN